MLACVDRTEVVSAARGQTTSTFSTAARPSGGLCEGGDDIRVVEALFA